jgi:hypothetical protein
MKLFLLLADTVCASSAPVVTSTSLCEIYDTSPADPVIPTVTELGTTSCLLTAFDARAEAFHTVQYDITGNTIDASGFATMLASSGGPSSSGVRTSTSMSLIDNVATTGTQLTGVLRFSVTPVISASGLPGAPAELSLGIGDAFTLACVDLPNPPGNGPAYSCSATNATPQTVLGYEQREMLGEVAVPLGVSLDFAWALGSAGWAEYSWGGASWSQLDASFEFFEADGVTPVQLTSVPEPSSWLIAGCALLLGYCVRKDGNTSVSFPHHRLP